MSPSHVASEAIGTALRDLAMFAIWMILVAAVVMAIVSGLLALRRRQEAGLRDQAADRQAVTRPALITRTVAADPRRQLSTSAYGPFGSGRGESAADTPRVLVPSRK
jgi:hypothetical protein